jgi:protein tyrosine phosphatase (PTP) superfamily phosphohydrolase (DUF442 family)
MTTLSRLRSILRCALVMAAVMVVPVLAFVAWDQATHNLGPVVTGSIYRSGQMPASALGQTIRERRIKTVVNLRGSNPSDKWYRDELSTTLEQGATHVDIAMSSCLWMSRAQLRMLVETLEKSDRPLLIHCAWGSERTGLASAFAELLRPGSTIEDARAQFSMRYLFVRINDGKVMAEHLDEYENWLHKIGQKHTPANFHRWVDEGFQPGRPSREEWPYDPYPLVVVNRPEGGRPLSQPVATGSRSHPARK